MCRSHVVQGAEGVPAEVHGGFSPQPKHQVSGVADDPCMGGTGFSRHLGLHAMQLIKGVLCDGP